MTDFEYESLIEATAILGAIEDLGLGFTHYKQGLIVVDCSLQSQVTYINDAVEKRMNNNV